MCYVFVKVPFCYQRTVCVYEHACSMCVRTCLQYACTNMPAVCVCMPAVCVYEHACSMRVRTCLQYACTNMPAVCVYEHACSMRVRTCLQYVSLTMYHACSMRVRTCLQYPCTNMPAVCVYEHACSMHVRTCLQYVSLTMYQCIILSFVLSQCPVIRLATPDCRMMEALLSVPLATSHGMGLAFFTVALAWPQ